MEGSKSFVKDFLVLRFQLVKGGRFRSALTARGVEGSLNLATFSGLGSPYLGILPGIPCKGLGF